MKKILCVVIIVGFGLGFNTIEAQDVLKVSELVTDRPDKTESSVAIPFRYVQIETGFSYTFDSQILSDETSVGFGETLIRYGLFEGMELRLAMDYSTLSHSYHSSPVQTQQNGISPIVFGTKINLTEQNGCIPEMALLAHIQVSVFASDFYTEYAIPEIILSASHTITDRFSLGYNIGIGWEDNDMSPTKNYSLAAGFGVSDKIGFYVETFGSFGKEDFQNLFDGGFTFLIMPNLQFDISAGLGVTPSSSDFFIGSGVSMRLPQ